jgi:DegV family protein with EDD domain
MNKLAIITDSTSYIPDDLVSKYHIHVTPQVLIWGEKTYEDGIDILPSVFYQKLSTSKVMPTTSQVTPATFQKLYSKLAKEENDILAILISNQLSGTIKSALQAKEDFPGTNIEIIDSETTAMALGFVVLATARAAQDGASLKDCIAVANKAKENVGVVFAVDTLEFLHRGGRIGGAQKLLGTALKMKPILEVTGGRVEGIERVRTRSKSLSRLVEVIEERINGRSPIHLATLHANSPADAKELLTTASSKFNAVESIFSEVSPVIGTHAGPGTVGLAFMAGL